MPRDRRSVLVTGGSSGIGLALAELMASRGADVALLARDPSRLGSARRFVEEACVRQGQRVLASSVDVTDAAAVRSVIDDLAGEGFDLDIVVNSAGVLDPGRFDELPLDAFERHMDIGYLGTVNTCRAVLPYLKSRSSGHIVNISSVSGFVGVYGYGAYTPVKFAVIGLSEVLRSELKPHGIHVTVVCPPDTDTPLLEREVPMRPPETQTIAGAVKPVSADFVARAIAEGIDKRRFLVVPGAESRLLYMLVRLAPGLVRRITDRAVAKARKNGS